jgi:hypothetical protein
MEELHTPQEVGGGGGLGIKDLDKFGRALRLRWLWHSWDAQERPWKAYYDIMTRQT